MLDAREAVTRAVARSAGVQPEQINGDLRLEEDLGIADREQLAAHVEDVLCAPVWSPRLHDAATVDDLVEVVEALRPPCVTSEIDLPTAGSFVGGLLALPEDPIGLVIFAHGSGSSRHSPRNQYVAAGLIRRGLGTLLFDLLTPEEEAVDLRTRSYRFDIPRLARRLERVARWVGGQPELAGLRIGYFGSSTGAAAALVAAVERPAGIGAVVSRGGRPDLAGDALSGLRAPTLLVVGSRDRQVLELNHLAARQMTCLVQVEVVRGATHLFQEPGALDQVVGLAGDWYLRHLPRAEG